MGHGRLGKYDTVIALQFPGLFPENHIVLLHVHGLHGMECVHAHAGGYVRFPSRLIRLSLNL